LGYHRCAILNIRESSQIFVSFILWPRRIKERPGRAALDSVRRMEERSGMRASAIRSGLIGG
jgi:hypothetical protein